MPTLWRSGQIKQSNLFSSVSTLRRVATLKEALFAAIALTFPSVTFDCKTERFRFSLKLFKQKGHQAMDEA